MQYIQYKNDEYQVSTKIFMHNRPLIDALITTTMRQQIMWGPCFKFCNLLINLKFTSSCKIVQDYICIYWLYLFDKNLSCVFVKKPKNTDTYQSLSATQRKFPPIFSQEVPSQQSNRIAPQKPDRNKHGAPISTQVVRLRYMC